MHERCVMWPVGKASTSPLCLHHQSCRHISMEVKVKSSQVEKFGSAPTTKRTQVHYNCHK